MRQRVQSCPTQGKPKVWFDQQKYRERSMNRNDIFGMKTAQKLLQRRGRRFEPVTAHRKRAGRRLLPKA
jgi:hypothetical protein